MLKILLVPVNDLISHPIETRFIFLGTKLVEKFDVKLSVLRYTNIPTSSKRERKLNFELVDFKNLRTGNVGLYYAMNAIPMSSALIGRLRKEDFDIIIHANILPSTIAVTLGRIFHKPLIYDYQDYFPESAAIYFKGDFLRSFVHSLTSQLTTFNVKNSDAIVTVTQAHKEQIKKCAPSKLTEVIPNGVNSGLFRPMPKSQALKHLGLEELSGKTILIYFGAIDPWLDFSTVFKAIQQLVAKGYDIVLFIVGFSHSRYYLDETKEEAKSLGVGNRLLIFDAVSQDKLVYYINASDVTIVPYKPLMKNQAVPLKVLESLACGKFVCVTNLSEIAQRFGDSVGLYSSEEDLERRLLEYLKGRTQTSTGRRARILSEYSWDNIARSYHDLITRVVNGER